MAADDFMDQTNPEESSLIKTPSDQAEEKKEEGNELYKTKKYIDALSKYSEAISLCPDNPAFYGNRSACFMMLGQYSNALEDAKRSVSINPDFIKGYIRVAKCCIMLGDVMSAKQAIQQVETLDPGNTALKSEVVSLEHLESYKSNADVAFQSGDYRKAVYLLNQCHSIASGANDIKVYLAECLAYLGRLDESKEIVYDLLRSNSMDADAIYVKGLCLYYEDIIPKAFSHFQRVLMLAPDHHKAKEVFKKAKLLKQKKDDGNAAFKDNKLSEAYALYSEALLIDPLNSSTNAKLFFNRATVAAKLGKLEESIEDCNSALGLDQTYLKALMRRAESYMALEDYESAVKDYETLNRKDRYNSEYQELLRNAKMELKRSQRKDYYKILGVAKDANDDEIKKAYRKRALVHHPDRHSNASEKERVEHEKIFKEVGEAYGILSDRKKRSKYDNGGDYESGVDPTQVFQTFFGTGMQEGFSGMPGGYHFQFG
uniref:DnaJ homolog subfamily C member 7 n=1 Tax=Caligus clemensi TaxID=344056 RepID=C1C1D2_CALCM|nr:DnaJ homolog subfamily C member 7 [Caligus clemensi]